MLDSLQIIKFDFRGQWMLAVFFPQTNVSMCRKKQDFTNDRSSMDAKNESESSLRNARTIEFENESIELAFFLAKARIVRCLGKPAPAAAASKAVNYRTIRFSGIRASAHDPRSRIGPAIRTLGVILRRRSRQ